MSRLGAVMACVAIASPGFAQSGRYEFELVRLEKMIVLMEKRTGCMWSKPLDPGAPWMLDHPGKGDRGVEANCKAVLSLAASGMR